MKRVLIQAALSGAVFLLFLNGCAIQDSLTSDITAWASNKGFNKYSLTSTPFHLTVFLRRNFRPNNTLTVYIEGDGAPWPTPYHPPLDPTPTHPLALTLAIEDSAPAVVYIARPCQYLDKKALANCDISYWTERRFSTEVVSAYDESLNQLKALFQFKHLRLVGYSGGGVIATLLADKRRDIDLLVTVAAPLSVSEWIDLHELSALTGSLDPASPEQSLHLPPAIHFIGENDQIVPSTIVRSFTQLKGGRVIALPGFSHECCWTRNWSKIIESLPAMEKLP